MPPSVSLPNTLLLRLNTLLLRLNTLRICLDALSSTIPIADSATPTCDFRSWNCDLEILEDLGSYASLLNRDLEVVLAPGGRRSGPCPVRFTARRQGLTAVASAITKVLLVDDRTSDATLEKWIDNLTTSSQSYGETEDMILSDVVLVENAGVVD
ncbi:uncharacterized protein BXZ73DRAFT_79918 [Epithele typhae]|uniref:uncharacterized protein n=1 Tax=Epithele typhae TaxID=378194 RepID=UPI00200757E3|nr:uncharacterized protein BXZ73DRAFT_105064 [Epithele typhae]XP_047874756.1 uncharacterized protein BXZ73DRAFT_79918 [Epithele typhae]KAH9918909.1 hypothetical protein BXZ73DRAFT_105064 [Epithele typhae]KAH9921521.1 hypothetical protein BXZ73DRAFT_79918 [Epithele typhae]